MHWIVGVCPRLCEAEFQANLDAVITMFPMDWNHNLMLRMQAAHAYQRSDDGIQDHLSRIRVASKEGESMPYLEYWSGFGIVCNRFLYNVRRC